jgi:PAS domain S-box-containing protein
LKENELTYRTFFETARDGAFVTGLDGAIIDCNQGFWELFGYNSKSEIQKVNVSNLYLDPNDRLKFGDELIKKEF